MQLGMVGTGRMGGNMVRRLLRGEHACVVYDRSPHEVAPLVAAGAVGCATIGELLRALAPPRAVWLMVPAAAVDGLLAELAPDLDPGDIVIDGGNSYYHDDIARARRLAPRGIHYVDCGTSGGVWGLERGYCLMIGGEPDIVRHLDPIFATLAPGLGTIARTPGAGGRAGDRHGPAQTGPGPRDGSGREPGTAERGYLHCGPPGAGHFVKMVHNGIEYGLMAAYAEGLNILKHAGVGDRPQAADAETAPLQHPEHFRYDLPLADIAEVWRRGSVIASWLLDLTAAALREDPDLEKFSGRVSDSGEGRWTIAAAIEAGVPAHVLTAALYERFDSRGEAEFQNKVLSAMRFAFGGHFERRPGT